MKKRNLQSEYEKRLVQLNQCRQSVIDSSFSNPCVCKFFNDKDKFLGYGVRFYKNPKIGDKEILGNDGYCVIAETYDIVANAMGIQK